MRKLVVLAMMPNGHLAPNVLELYKLSATASEGEIRFCYFDSGAHLEYVWGRVVDEFKKDVSKEDFPVVWIGPHQFNSDFSRYLDNVVIEIAKMGLCVMRAGVFLPRYLSTATMRESGDGIINFINLGPDQAWQECVHLHSEWRERQALTQ